MSGELGSMLERAHDGITTFDFDGRKTPCILFGAEKFDAILQRVAGEALSVDTDLNILQDGLGHVFVEMILAFSKGGFVEKVLVNANKSPDFFESLAETSILALSSPGSRLGRDSVFVIQLPRPDRAAGALDVIRKGLALHGPGDQWCSCRDSNPGHELGKLE